MANWKSLEEADKQQWLIHLLSQDKAHRTLHSTHWKDTSCPVPATGQQHSWRSTAARPASCRNSKPHLAASAMHSSDTEVTGQRCWAHFHPQFLLHCFSTLYILDSSPLSFPLPPLFCIRMALGQINTIFEN